MPENKVEEPIEEEVIESEEVKQGLNTWRTVYSDMTTNLALFFLILFAFTRLSAVKRQELISTLAQLGKKSDKPTVEQVINQQTEQLTDKLKDIATVEVKEEEIVITLPSPVLFDSGKAELKDAAKTILDEVATTLKSIPNEIVIEGHTDNVPIVGGKYKSNWELSAARAFSVIEYFSRYHQISPARLSAVGYGEYRPVAPNDTEENRAKNRRIGIKIIKR